MKNYLPSLVIGLLLLFAIISPFSNGQFLSAQIITGLNSSTSQTIQPESFGIRILNPIIKTASIGANNTFSNIRELITLVTTYCCFTVNIDLSLRGELVNQQQTDLPGCKRCSNNRITVDWTIPPGILVDQINQSNPISSSITYKDVIGQSLQSITISDLAKDIGSLNSISDTSGISQAQITSLNPKVIVWLGNDKAYQQKTTATFSDRVYACLDDDSDGNCDFLQLACSDGIDNDGDGKTDFPNDPNCSTGADNDEAPDQNATPTPSSADLIKKTDSYYARLKKGETGSQACQRVGAENTLEGVCEGTSLPYDQQNQPDSICLSFNPSASSFDASSQNTTDPSRAAYGAKNTGFCDTSSSIACDKQGALKDSSNPDQLTNTCVSCSDCQPSTCESTPQSLGLDELYVECSFTNAALCNPDIQSGSLILRQQLLEEFNNTKTTPENTAPIEIDLINLIQDDLDPGEKAPDNILIKKITIKQQAAATITLFNGQDVTQLANKPQGSFTVDLINPPIAASKIYIPASTGMVITYTRVRNTSFSSTQSISLANSDQIKDLGAIESFPELASQVSQGAVQSYAISDLTGPFAVWIAPAPYSGTTPLQTSKTALPTDHIFLCKDSDVDGNCDAFSCPAPATTNTSQRSLSIDHSNGTTQLLRQDLLQADQTLQIISSCDTCTLQFDKDPSQFKGGQGDADKGFFLHIRSIDSQDASIAHTILLFGKAQTIDKLSLTKGTTWPKYLSPTVLNLAKNNYAFQRPLKNGSIELVPVDGQVLEQKLGEPLINGQVYPHLFLVQAEDGTWLSHLTQARYWNISTLKDPLYSPANIIQYFQNLPSNPTSQQCEEALKNMPDAGNFLKNANSFQVSLDLLTLCNRL